MKGIGMFVRVIGALLLCCTTSHAEVHEVVVRNFEFEPATVNITEGDAVRWVWESGSHTTTSGDPAACTPDGTWDAPIDAANPVFELQFNDAGEFPYYCMPHCVVGMNGMVTVLPVVGVGDANPVVVTGPVLLRTSPNPFTPKTTIRYEIPRAGAVRLSIYAVTGRQVRTLYDEVQRAGAHAVDWNGRDAGNAKVPAGIYFAQLDFAGEMQIQRLVLVR